MNILQYRELLKSRGITKLRTGQSVQDAIDETGGEPTDKELSLINERLNSSK